MRIISGRLKGLVLTSAKNIRPTEEKLRKAVFDSLGDFIKRKSFLDIYAGTGSVGLEAISRAAKSVTFVENNFQSIRALRDNITKSKRTLTKAGESCLIELLRLDALKAVASLGGKNLKFDIVFCDAPYYGELTKKTLQTLDSYDILSPDGILVVQAYKKDLVTTELSNIRPYRSKTYSDTAVYFYTKR
ncbi:MAG: 16S rRNA (guanine(966)-N(2))-methyltransferase RsmD [Candidatus Gygaella obscura]|nr:16S rRNA (guanine(966)-N(2))-methyltransferase RsmD [Candidatus Gygaella obscura]